MVAVVMRSCTTVEVPEEEAGKLYGRNSTSGLAPWPFDTLEEKL